MRRSSGPDAGDWLYRRLFPGVPCAHVSVADGLFLLCTVPFWTSNVIRMISWIPFLGLNGIFNQTLIALGVVDKPLEFLLFSDVAVVIAYVHLFTLFMIVPIFNSMAALTRRSLRQPWMRGPTPGR